MKLKLDLKKLIILFLARTKSTVKIAGKIDLLLVVLAEKKQPLNGSWLATSFSHLLLAGGEERLLFSHGR